MTKWKRKKLICKLQMAVYQHRQTQINKYLHTHYTDIKNNEGSSKSRSWFIEALEFSVSCKRHLFCLSDWLIIYHLCLYLYPFVLSLSVHILPSIHQSIPLALIHRSSVVVFCFSLHCFKSTELSACNLLRLLTENIWWHFYWSFSTMIAMTALHELQRLKTSHQWEAVRKLFRTEINISRRNGVG